MTKNTLAEILNRYTPYINKVLNHGTETWRANTLLKIMKDITDRDGYLKYKSSTLNPCLAWSLGSARAHYINLHNA
jgi:hypothetical protein